MIIRKYAWGPWGSNYSIDIMVVISPDRITSQRRVWNLEIALVHRQCVRMNKLRKAVQIRDDDGYTGPETE
jgi:hypothetical protein